MQHIALPTNPILSGAVAGLLVLPVQWNDSNIMSGIKQFVIEATTARPVLVDAWAEIITPFNAGTTNILTVGTDQVSANQILAAGDITEGTIGFYPANNAIKKFRFTSQTSVWIRYNGGALANSTLTSNNTQVTEGDTVTLTDPTTGTTEVYTFRATPVAEGDVDIGADADGSLLNLIRAINHSGTAGTDYIKTAASVLVTAATSVTSHAFLVTAIRGGTIGNLIQTSDTAVTLSWTSTVMANGTNGSVSAGSANIYLRVTQLDPKNNRYLGV